MVTFSVGKVKSEIIVTFFLGSVPSNEIIVTFFRAQYEVA
jgi:hypothetical protein